MTFFLLNTSVLNKIINFFKKKKFTDLKFFALYIVTQNLFFK